MNIYELIKKIDEIEKNISEIKNWIVSLTNEENKDFVTLKISLTGQDLMISLS